MPETRTRTAQNNVRPSFSMVRAGVVTPTMTASAASSPRTTISSFSGGEEEDHNATDCDLSRLDRVAKSLEAQVAYVATGTEQNMEALRRINEVSLRQRGPSSQLLRHHPQSYHRRLADKD